MKLIEAKVGVIDVSADVLSQYATGIGEQFPAKTSESGEIAESFLKFDLEDVLHILESRGFPHLKSIRSLVAHGKSDEMGDFHYLDRTASYETVSLAPVQAWVDMYDGRYDVLLIYPCNPAGVRLSSRASFLVYSEQGLFNSEDIKTARYYKKSNLLFQPPKHV